MPNGPSNTASDLDEEDRMKAALEAVVEKKDPALKELVVRLTAIRCRIQSSKCSHLVPFARSETEATVLKNLSLGWALVASQTARYDEIMEMTEGPAQPPQLAASFSRHRAGLPSLVRRTKTRPQREGTR
jgi:hypothetical protein